MIMSKIFFSFFFFIFSVAAFPQPGLHGQYRLPNGLDVELFRTGDTWSGKIVGLNDFNGGQVLDVKNPDKSRRNIPLKGLVIIRGLTYDPEEKIWTGGTMYAPEKGMEFDLKITRRTPEGLEVVGSKLFLRKTLFWKRLTPSSS